MILRAEYEGGMTGVMPPFALPGDHGSMVTALRAVPAVLSSLLLAAHFLRSGNMLLVVACASLPLLMLVPSRYARYAFQAILVLGALEWIRTAMAIAEIRLQIGAPWGRMAAIIGGVALFTIISALIVPKPRAGAETAGATVRA